MRIRSSILSSFLILSVLGGTSVLTRTAHAQSTPPAAPDTQLRLTGGAIAAGIGYTWGSGQLDAAGDVHSVSISGLSIVDVGAAKIDARGSVYRLKKLSDFDGVYTTFAAGATIAGGGGVAYLRNQNGVVIRLDSTTEGLRFNLSAGGISLKIAS